MSESRLTALGDRRGLEQWIREIRRTVHGFPELGYRETRTAGYILEKLCELGIENCTRYGGTGIRVDLERGKGGHVALRADMDGLPLEERTGLDFSSKIPGAFHGCGHDGHVAMLLGAIAILQNSAFQGKISCIFQPAEEHGNGAEQLVRERVLDETVSSIFAGHIDTHFPTGTITVDNGVICAASDPFRFALHGSGGHAARPHEARDPLVAGAALVMGLQTLVSRETDPNQAAVVTVGSFRAGDAHNIIADSAVIEGTVRTTHHEVRKRILEGLERMGAGVGDQYRIDVELAFHDGLPMVDNDEQAATLARNAALKVVGRERTISQGPPSLGGEDFAFYLQQVPGCLVRFGAQKTGAGPAHSSTFDFDEDVLITGSSWLAEVARLALRAPQKNADEVEKTGGR